MATVVPTGGMVIGRQGTLKAFLGSCVGLALHDPVSNVGGMLHILLPEPVCDIPDYHSTYYASTGIPVFVEAIQKQGARIENLSAYIAGGALLDTLSPQDKDLNIAHHTLEITLSLVKKNRIAIKMLEASGVNPFCLTLQIEKGACRIEPILMEKAQVLPEKKHVKLDMIMETIERLIPVPQMAFNIARMLSDEGVDIGSIAEEIKKDQVLSAKILRLCNSAYMGLSRKIASIDNAILYLGSKTLLQMVITAQIENIYHTSEKGYSLCRGGMFHHALASARLCKAMAMEHRGIDPDIAYTAGLIHDIGKVVLDQYIADMQPLFYKMIMEQKEDSSVLERKMIGIDHCHSGSCWQTPGTFPTCSRTDPLSSCPLLDGIQPGAGEPGVPSGRVYGEVPHGHGAGAGRHGRRQEKPRDPEDESADSLRQAERHRRLRLITSLRPPSGRAL